MGWLLAGRCVRLATWHCTERQPGLTSERSQPWHLVGFVHCGAYRLHAPDDSCLIDGNRVAFFNAASPYQTSHPCGCGDSGSSLVVRSDVLGDVLRRHDQRAWDDDTELFRASHGPCPTRAFLRHRSVVRALSQGLPIEPLAAEELALGVLEELVAAFYAERSHRAAAERITPAGRDAVEWTRDFLARNAGRPLTLDDIAAAADLSPSRLCRVFPIVTGLSVHRYLNRLRLRASLERLADHRGDITDLALGLGYSSHSHFTFAFRQEFGLTPSRWQRGMALERAG